ncbi:hypothetical protein SBA4_2150015 [Candidatus Sulfopaludibacter sp. SbA4]|nr:hypothetical protein SBA4_2150015 [Candidatus Sulfopaludibacter sp. SbA4]
MQPCLRHLQLAMQRGFRDVERGGAFLVGEPSEEREFDDLAFARVVGGEPLQGFIEINQVERSFFANHDGLVERDFFRTAALLAGIGAGVIDQDVAHAGRLAGETAQSESFLSLFWRARTEPKRLRHFRVKGNFHFGFFRKYAQVAETAMPSPPRIFIAGDERDPLMAGFVSADWLQGRRSGCAGVVRESSDGFHGTFSPS